MKNIFNDRLLWWRFRTRLVRVIFKITVVIGFFAFVARINGEVAIAMFIWDAIKIMAIIMASAIISQSYEVNNELGTDDDENPMFNNK